MRGRHCRRSLFRRSTGKNIRGHYIRNYFLFLPPFFLLLVYPSQKGVLESKIKSNVDGVTSKTYGWTTFHNSYCNFGPLVVLQEFWISQTRNIKTEYVAKVDRRLQYLRMHLFPDHIVYFCQGTLFCLKRMSGWFMKRNYLNPISYGLSDTGGGASEAPLKISRKEWSLTQCCYIAFVCKNSDQNLKIWARFQDFKILWNWNFASHWETKKLLQLALFGRYWAEILYAGLILIVEQIKFCKQVSPANLHFF